jgi:hypothetical protein
MATEVIARLEAFDATQLARLQFAFTLGVPRQDRSGGLPLKDPC